MTRLGSRYEAVKQDLPADVAFMLRELRTRKDPRFAAALRLARDNGWTIRTLALEVGMTMDAVARRVQRAAGQVAPGIVIPAAPRHAYVEDPRPPLDPETVSRLRALQRRASLVRGGTPANHPNREAGRQLNAELYALNQRGYGYQTLADIFGVWQRAISQRVERAIEGYRCDQRGDD